MTVVAVGGSRHLQEEALVRNILGFIRARGWRVATGCAPGIDATVRQVAMELGLPLTVYAAGMREGDPWGGRMGTRMQLRGMEAGGVCAVVWSPEKWSAASLRARTLALAAAADRVIGITAADSRGTRLLLSEAARLGRWHKEYRRGEV